MVVRSVEDGFVHCCWFDGRHYREATLMRDAVRPSSGTRDDRLYQV
ncbi:MAG: hypothetical protein JWP41_4122 [Ramlibacter sp.]|nr:hypothetical protein [Ramlibacter sp.]